MRLNRSRAVKRLLLSIGLGTTVLSATTCGALSEPGARNETFALAMINGAPARPDRNLLTECMPEHAAQGAEPQILGDTLVLHPSGHGEWRTHQRSRAADYQLTVDSVRVFFYDRTWEFRYVRAGRDIMYSGEQVRGTLRTVRGGALEYAGFCGVWVFERV